MFYSLKENAGGLKHLLKRIHRVLFRVPVTRPFEELLKSSDKVRLILDDGGKPVRCKGCGYAIVRLVYDDGWAVEGCSAITVNKLINNTKFENWVEAIPRNRVKTEVV